MRILARIVRLALQHKWMLLGAYLFMATATAAYMMLPTLVGRAVDDIAGYARGQPISDAAMLTTALLILGIGALRGLLSFGQTYMGEAVGLRVVYELRNRFYDHVQNLSFAFHDRQHTGNLMSRAISDVEAMRMFVNGGLVRGPYFLILAIAAAFLMLRLDWRLGLLAMSFMPAVAVMSVFVRLRLRRIWTKIQEDMGDLSTTVQENLTGVRVVKSFAADEFEMAKFSERSGDVRADMVAAARLQAINTSFIMGMYMLAMALILLYGGSRIMSGHITVGEMVQFLIYLQILSQPVRFTGMMVNNFARAISAGHRLFEVLDARSPVQESRTALELSRVRGHVRFDNVGFSYYGGTEVLKGIDIDARSGEVVALLGAPGSGKSTTTNLLPRFYDVTWGRVTIDGIDVRDVTLRSLRRNIGIVQQDVFLFGASLKENIAYGREDATMDEIVRAAKVAQLHEYIMGLDDGYDTVIGERGATLSGGQRQRMSIARAILLDPPILILDDSTSSVDAGTEELIRTAMESVMRGRTTFVIAHRLSTVHRADQILVLDNGEVVERGTHFELLAIGGLYHRIHELQLRPQEEVMMEIDVSGSAGRWRGT